MPKSDILQTEIFDIFPGLVSVFLNIFFEFPRVARLLPEKGKKAPLEKWEVALIARSISPARFLLLRKISDVSILNHRHHISYDISHFTKTCKTYVIFDELPSTKKLQTRNITFKTNNPGFTFSASVFRRIVIKMSWFTDLTGIVERYAMWAKTLFVTWTTNLKE